MTLAAHYRSEFETMVNDVPCRVGLCYRHSSGGAAAYPASDLAAGLFTAVWAKMKPLLATPVRLMRIIVHPLDATGGNPYEANYDNTVIGTHASTEPLPPSIAALFKLRCSSPQSRNNGHIYLAGCGDSAWNDNQWIFGGGSALADWLTQLAAAVTGGGGSAIYKPCVVSRFDAGVKRPSPIAYDVVSASLVNRASQQRRRQSGMQGMHV